MFDTMKIAAVIKAARIHRNMTQMQLADALGVSYQAVSNWERGNSMPDISKLEDLCRALDITVEQLLGMEPRAAAAVSKVMAEEELTVEELTEVAPVLTPKELKKQVKAEKKRRKLRLDAIADLAPFLGQAELEELLADAEFEDPEELEDIAPFLSHETLDRLVEAMDLGSLEHLDSLAPFLSRETLGKVAARCSAEEEFEIITDLAPFLGQEILDKLVDDRIAAEYDPEELDLSDLYPFLSKAALGRLSRYLLACRDLEALEELMPFA